jgi:hypothetical protein
MYAMFETQPINFVDWKEFLRSDPPDIEVLEETLQTGHSRGRDGVVRDTETYGQAMRSSSGWPTSRTENIRIGVMLPELLHLLKSASVAC